MTIISTTCKIFFLLSLILIFQLNLFAQDTLHISFESPQNIVQEFSETAPLYKFTGNTIYYNNKFYPVQFPNDFIVEDTAFTFVFFQGWKNPPIPQHTVVLVGNYKQAPIVIIDSNHNLDFSDDKRFFWKNQKAPLEFELPNSEYEEAKTMFNVRIKPIRNPEVLEKVKGFTTTNPTFNKNKPVHQDYWWDIDRINYRSTISVLANDSIRIGLVDGTGNGLFNDIKWDRILVGDKQKEFSNEELMGDGYPLEEKLKIIINDKTYIVKEVEAGGKHIILEDSDIEIRKLNEGSVIPNFSFNSISGGKYDLYSLSRENKFVLLDFWGTWCKPCIENIPKLAAIHAKYEDIKIVGLISHDDNARATQFIEKNKITWLNGIATDEMLKELFVQYFPRYILIDEDHKIVKFNANLVDIEALAKEKY